MPSQLPFPVPAKLPKKIEPCPILEAVMEVRFVPNRPWSHVPGLFAGPFEKKYPKEEETGIAQIPQIIRDRDPALLHAAYQKRIGEHFTLQYGPRMVNLVTNSKQYPGWEKFWPAMSEVLSIVKDLGLVRETVRLGLRYINFFSFDIYDQLTMKLSVGEKPIKLPELGWNFVLQQEPFRHQLHINNAAVVNGEGNKPVLGSILDIDTTISTKTDDPLDSAEKLFSEAHQAEKSVFFGLLKSEYIDTLKPQY